MSRIYDALQRANQERGISPESDNAEFIEPFTAPGEMELPPVQEEILFDLITRHPWNPSLDSLPTLGDRGEGIEQFRGLRTQIYQFRDQAPLKTILISSGIARGGKVVCRGQSGHQPGAQQNQYGSAD